VCVCVCVCVCVFVRLIFCGNRTFCINKIKQIIKVEKQ